MFPISGSLRARSLCLGSLALQGRSRGGRGGGSQEEPRTRRRRGGWRSQGGRYKYAGRGRLTDEERVQLTEKRRNRALAGSASAKAPPRFSCPPALPHVAGLPWAGGSGAQFQLSLFFLLHSPQTANYLFAFHGFVTNLPPPPAAACKSMPEISYS